MGLLLWYNDDAHGDPPLNEMATCLLEWSGLSLEDVTAATTSAVEAFDPSGDLRAHISDCCSALSGFDESTKASVVKDLIRIAAADGEGHKNEAWVISFVAAELGLKLELS